MADHTTKQLRNLFIYQLFVRNYSEEGTLGSPYAISDYRAIIVPEKIVCQD